MSVAILTEIVMRFMFLLMRLAASYEKARL